MADPVFVSAGFVRQVTRSRQFKAILLFVQQKQTFDLGQNVPEGRCKLRGGLREFLKRHVQRNLFVQRVGKGFDFLDTFWQPAGAGHFLKLGERAREARREHGAVINRHDYGALRQEISQRPRHPASHCPLRAVSIAIGLRRMLHDRAIPRNSAKPQERFAQNVLFESQLLRCRNVLVVAAAAFLKMSALCFFAIFGRGSDLQQFGPDQSLLLRFRGCPHLFARQNIRHENGISIGMRQTVTAVNEFFNRDF